MFWFGCLFVQCVVGGLFDATIGRRQLADLFLCFVSCFVVVLHQVRVSIHLRVTNTQSCEYDGIPMGDGLPVPGGIK